MTSRRPWTTSEALRALRRCLPNVEVGASAIGAGSYGTVFPICATAGDATTCTHVAKIGEVPLSDEDSHGAWQAAASEQWIAERLGEKGIGPRVEHAEICTVDIDSRRVVYPITVMERFDKSLESALPLVRDDVRPLLAAAVGELLERMHRMGLVHGDLKPANIVLNAEPRRTVRLIDFGFTHFAGAPATVSMVRRDEVGRCEVVERGQNSAGYYALVAHEVPFLRALDAVMTRWDMSLEEVLSGGLLQDQVSLVAVRLSLGQDAFPDPGLESALVARAIELGLINA